MSDSGDPAPAAGAESTGDRKDKKDKKWFRWSLTLEHAEGLPASQDLLYVLRWQVLYGRNSTPSETPALPVKPFARSHKGRRGSTGGEAPPAAEVTDGVQWSHAIQFDERIPQSSEGVREKVLQLTLLAVHPGEEQPTVVRTASVPLAKFLERQEKQRIRLGRPSIVVSGRARALAADEARQAQKEAARATPLRRERRSADGRSRDRSPSSLVQRQQQQQQPQQAAAEPAPPPPSAALEAAAPPAPAADVDAVAAAAGRLFDAIAEQGPGSEKVVTSSALLAACRDAGAGSRLSDPARLRRGSAVRRAVRRATEQEQHPDEGALWAKLVGVAEQAAPTMPDQMQRHEFVSRFRSAVLALQGQEQQQQPAPRSHSQPRIAVYVVTSPGQQAQILELRATSTVHKVFSRCQDKLGYQAHPDDGLWLEGPTLALGRPPDAALPSTQAPLYFIGDQSCRQAVGSLGVVEGSWLHILPRLPGPDQHAVRWADEDCPFRPGDAVVLTREAASAGMWPPALAAGEQAEVLQVLSAEAVVVRCPDGDDCEIPVGALAPVPAVPSGGDAPHELSVGSPPPRLPIVPGVGADLVIPLPVGPPLRVTVHPQDTVGQLRQRLDAELGQWRVTAGGDAVQWMDVCHQVLLVGGTPLMPGQDDVATLGELGIVSDFSVLRRVELRFLMSPEQRGQAEQYLRQRQEALDQLREEQDRYAAACRGGAEYLAQLQAAMQAASQGGAPPQHLAQAARMLGVEEGRLAVGSTGEFHQLMRDSALPEDEEGDLVRELRELHDEIASCELQASLTEQLEMEMPEAHGSVVSVSEGPPRLGSLLRHADERAQADELTETRERRALLEELKDDELRHRQRQIRVLKERLRLCNAEADRLLEQWRELKLEGASTESCAAEIAEVLGLDRFELELHDPHEDLGLDVCPVQAADLPPWLPPAGPGQRTGLKVAAVVAHSAAYDAGVHPGLLYSFDGRRVMDTDDLGEAAQLFRQSGRHPLVAVVEIRTKPGWPTEEELRTAADLLSNWASATGIPEAPSPCHVQ